MFLAYNKPIHLGTIDAKADLMAETLKNLRTDKISDFFKFVRSSEDMLPNDGILGKILRANYKQFSKAQEVKQLEAPT